MGSIQFDDQEAGILKITFEGMADTRQFADYLETVSRRLAQQRPYIVVLDARYAERTPAMQRKMQADWIASHRPELEQYCAGTVFVISSPLVRGALTAILWLQPLPSPHIVVGTLPAALDWARARVATCDGRPA